MNLHLLYDHQIFTQQRYGGISRYFCEIMSRFSNDPDIQLTLALRYSENENLISRQELKPSLSRKSIFLSNPVFPFINQVFHRDILLWLEHWMQINQMETIRLLKKQEFDLLHPTYYDPYFLKYLGKKPFVLTVHDMIHELYPHDFPPQDLTVIQKKTLIERADAIVAISKNTRDDILRFTDAEPDRITVIYHGNPFESLEQSLKSEPKYLKFEKPFILFVGKRQGYKNFEFFIHAMAPLIKSNESLHVCCAGGGPFTLNEQNLIRNLTLQSKVHYIQPKDMLLKSLYLNAQAFVFPSLYEGFGLPILEAFSNGCPVILSNSSSLPEIAADAAFYFDPNDLNSLTECIEAVLSDRKSRDELIKKGYERLKFFSWEKTATKTKQIYEDVLYQ